MIMKSIHWCLILFFSAFAAGCNSDLNDAEAIQIFNYEFDFSDSQDGWLPGFSGQSTRSEDSAFYQLSFAYTERPASTGDQGKSLMLSGNNKRGSIFMFVKKQITDLQPNTNYTLTFKVEVASNIQKLDPSAGVLYVPTGTYLKAGASDVEPKSFIRNDTYVMNIDKGDAPDQTGQHMTIIGDISVPENSSGYSLINRSNATTTSPAYAPFEARTNSDGDLWLIVGIDSGYAGLTRVYITNIKAAFSKSKNN